MTADLYVILRCDEPRCRATFPTRGYRVGTHLTARPAAVAEGWEFRDETMRSGDFCPEHASHNGSSPT